jgi:two-component system, OmpR family, sensor histidine kinase CiaH
VVWGIDWKGLEMFGKLRLKLALLNVAVAGLILLAIACVAYVFIGQTIARQSEQAIALVAHDLDSGSLGSMTPAETSQLAGGLYPYLVIKLDDSGLPSVTQYRIYLSQSQMSELVSTAITREQAFFASLGKVGTDQDRKVLFSKRSHSKVIQLSNGKTFRYSLSGFRPGSSSIYLIFMDIQQEQSLLDAVKLALGISVLGGLLLTLVGGLFLAGRALKPVKAAWQKQRNFVADASHELRSPLAAIRCNLDVVLDDPAAPVSDSQLYWEGISEETARMTTLVDELLLLARADSDTMVLQRTNVDMASVLEGAVCFMQPLAAKKNIELKLETSALPFVTGDQARLKQVLIALIDNAVKYTPDGGLVTVHIKKAKDRAIIDISDNGIGIGKEHLDKIFERFYRADKARERESGGHGLGLSIAHWIIQQHNGSISVASEEGKGSCFTISLPLIKE